MKLDSSDLEKITDLARRNINMESKFPRETADEFLARCWIDGLLYILKNKGCVVDVQLPKHSNGFVEPLED